MLSPRKEFAEHSTQLHRSAQRLSPTRQKPCTDNNVLLDLSMPQASSSWGSLGLPLREKEGTGLHFPFYHKWHSRFADPPTPAKSKDEES